MNKFTEKSYARITLSLDIIKKNTEGEFIGFHELGIIKHQIDLYDEISIFESDNLKIICDNKSVPTDNKNICWKVVDLVKNNFTISKNVSIEIKKNIPAQGGLAGGSSNAATTLNLLDKLWNLNLSFDDKVKIGQKLGMDIPFFFLGGTAFDSESSGILRKINTNSKFTFILVLPDFGVSTPEAYKNINYANIAKNVKKTKNIEELLVNDKCKDIYKFIHNDFEDSVFKSHPKLKELKKELLNFGVEQVVMSGSGSTLIAFVINKKKAINICNKLSCKSIVVRSL